MVRLAQEREVLQCFDGNHTPVLSSVSVFQLKHSGKGERVAVLRLVSSISTAPLKETGFSRSP